MELFGKNLRRRAQELGLSDAEVARLVGISERRYAFYVSGQREPDLATLVRISNSLQTSVDRLLCESANGVVPENERLQAQIQSLASTLDLDYLQLLAETTKVFAKNSSRRSHKSR